MRASVIVVAGGRGERLGGAIPKQLRLVGGRSLLERSISSFDAIEAIHEIVVVLPPALMSPPPACLSRFRTGIRIVVGGDRRQDSVALGFDAVSPSSDVIMIHDAARPFCTPELAQRILDAAKESGAAIAAVAAQDTVKEGDVQSGIDVVVRTVPREKIFLAQTPQAFTRPILHEAIALGRAGGLGTDEAALAEQAGYPVRLVEGDPRNIKITTEADLALAEEMTSRSEPIVQIRVGLGYDLHRLVAGRTLILAGVTIPGDRGLLGHSDADVVCHAVTDAILGAANAGDIGEHFPDDDARWKSASSIDLLGRATALIRDRGFVVSNVDVVVITDWPKIRDHAALMRQHLAQALFVSPDVVAVKGKTSEGVGPVGRGEAIVVHAVALVCRDGQAPC
jgi:2-C-methyl-D-erythritol 4-phosphate cytidylyltransferase/2-C-methyl-D-erythritol 2,4-cyclodiphosphate synthase